MSPGYTLVEALAALLIVGLAIAGLTEGVATIGRIQSSTAGSIGEAVALRDAASRFNAFMAGAGADLGGASRGLTGDAQQVSFSCGPRRCEARLSHERQGVVVELSGITSLQSSFPLPGLKDARFVYVGERTTRTSWPPPQSPKEVLRSVSIVGAMQGGQAPVATARLWLEQSRACEYDLISRACREPHR